MRVFQTHSCPLSLICAPPRECLDGRALPEQTPRLEPQFLHLELRYLLWGHRRIHRWQNSACPHKPTTLCAPDKKDSDTPAGGANINSSPLKNQKAIVVALVVIR